MNISPIGIFDSGFGGLSVWRAVRTLLPNESITYLGDGANCPYGSRSCEEVVALSEKAVCELINRGCKIVVIACNTATAAAASYLRTKYKGIDIVGIEPAVKPACEQSVSRKIGVLATQRSLEGEHFKRSIAKYSSDVEIIAAFGRGFVELVEQSRETTPEAEQIVRAIVEPMVKQGVDQIVLGCTHYPFLMPLIERIAPDVNIIDPSPAVARRVKQLLTEKELLAPEGSIAEYDFITYADESYRKRLKEKARESNISDEN
ncbi:MAG: glutamate racemase, partial [Rikenellaceae bacterium]